MVVLHSFGAVLRKNFASLRREMVMSGVVVRHGSISGSAVLYPRPGPERGSGLIFLKSKEIEVL